MPDMRKQVEELLETWSPETVIAKVATAYLALLEELECYKATVAVLENTDTVNAIAAGIEDIKAGRTIDLDKLDLLEACEKKNAALLEKNERLSYTENKAIEYAAWLEEKNEALTNAIRERDACIAAAEMVAGDLKTADLVKGRIGVALQQITKRMLEERTESHNATIGMGKALSDACDSEARLEAEVAALREENERLRTSEEKAVEHVEQLEDLVQENVHLKDELSGTGGIAACMRLNAAQRAEVAALTEALKRIAGPCHCARHSLAVVWMRDIATAALARADALTGEKP